LNKNPECFCFADILAQQVINTISAQIIVKIKMVGLGSDFYARAKASISRYTSVPHSLSYLGFQNGARLIAA
jgi:hypothetical protein